ncbi:MAG: SPOR domain-containing protein [Bryobacteraceae bacterium]
MISLLPKEPLAADSRPMEAAEESASQIVNPPVNQAAEFEIVVGRGQIASVLFVMTVVVVAFSSIFYLMGKASYAGQAPALVVTAPIAPAPPAATASPEPAAQKTPEPKPAKSEAPLYADAVSGALYIQTGAVDKGVATVIAEGLRTHRLDAFVAPGPNPTIFRVLIGPFSDSGAYARARATIGQIGLDEFTKRYQK